MSNVCHCFPTYQPVGAEPLGDVARVVAQDQRNFHGAERCFFSFTRRSASPFLVFRAEISFGRPSLFPPALGT